MRGEGEPGNEARHFVRFKSCDTCLCACAFQQQELRIVSCPGGGVWVAVTREFERDNCVTSEILQSDWTIPNRAGVPRKSTKVPRPSFVRESREGLGPRLGARGGHDHVKCEEFQLARQGMQSSYIFSSCDVMRVVVYARQAGIVRRLSPHAPKDHVI